MSINITKTGIIGPCSSSINYKTKNFKLEPMKEDKRTIKEKMRSEENFDVEDFLERVNSPEFKEKIDKATENILNTEFYKGDE